MVDSYIHAAAKTAHVNMLTDTVIANLPEDLLRGVMRAILTTQPAVTSLFEKLSRQALRKTTPPQNEEGEEDWGLLFVTDPENTIESTPQFLDLQCRLRAMIGCGLVWETIPYFQGMVRTLSSYHDTSKGRHESDTMHTLYSDGLRARLTELDGDIIMAMTAVQKSLASTTGNRELDENERQSLQGLLDLLLNHKRTCGAMAAQVLLPRSVASVAGVLGQIVEDDQDERQTTNPHFEQLASSYDMHVHPRVQHETFSLGEQRPPRLFSGLWQLSSPSWGSASHKDMSSHFDLLVASGFTAFDMADHYGDAEIVFGRLRNGLTDTTSTFAATKYCVFNKVTITAELIEAQVTERCRRLATGKIDLLQFHWQLYEDEQYLTALRLLSANERVQNVGLCNFDTKHMKTILDAELKIVTNQVQFSLIDARPRFGMGEVCERHNIKLLTYGTLCGGFLAEKWLGRPEPQLFSSDMTPSQRKYFEMITAWGDWKLFQELLRTLKTVAKGYGVTISNVATRWVLDFPYVGAVIVGARLGVSQHVEENLRTYGWKLSEHDQSMIEAVLEKSRRKEMFEAMGDCGSEYR